MPNPQLDSEQLSAANELLAHIRKRLDELCENDPAVRFAFLRKVWKELSYDERSKPAHRKALKRNMHGLQEGRCANCHAKIQEQYSVLDRIEAMRGYVASNVKLVCQKCDREIQARRRYR